MRGFCSHGTALGTPVLRFNRCATPAKLPFCKCPVQLHNGLMLIIAIGLRSVSSSRAKVLYACRTMPPVGEHNGAYNKLIDAARLKSMFY